MNECDKKKYKGVGYRAKDIIDISAKKLRMPVSLLQTYLLYKTIEAIDDIRLEKTDITPYILDLHKKLLESRGWKRFDVIKK
jgi:hypothetical protein